MKKLLQYMFVFFAVTTARAQQYTVNGFATQISCNEYRLTANAGGQNGSVWNNTKISLNQSFVFNFDVRLSQSLNDVNGADGIAFVLQPISTIVGSVGGGLGFSGISPSIGVTLDTYRNGTTTVCPIPPGPPVPDIDYDPVNDHIAIQRNGILSHCDTNNLTGPVDISATTGNVEDGLWHSLKIVWDAASKKLEAYFDGVLRVSVVNDFVNTTFAGDPFVYWGFTGSTGGLSNEQRFKTALNPSFHFLPNQKRCLNEPIQFIDSTVSFAPVSKFYWNFGDGSPIDSVNLNPVHTYTSAGNYTVTQTVIGADGCTATNTQQIIIGSKPIASFTYTDSCVNNSIQFNSTSTTSFGTIDTWFWDFDNGQTSTLPLPPFQTYTTSGNKLIKHWVRSLEGCESDTLIQPIHIYSRPVVSITAVDTICLGESITFNGTITPVNGDNAISWSWLIDGIPGYNNVLNPTVLFATPGNHLATFIASTNGGTNCFGAVSKNLYVKDKPYAAIKNVSICEGEATTLTDSSYTTDGAIITGWWWDLGNGSFSTQQNPSVTYNTTGVKTIRLAVRSGNCLSDTITKFITVNPNPVAKFNWQKPACFAKPVFFSDSSTISSGTITEWTWMDASNGFLVFGNSQNASHIFQGGSGSFLGTTLIVKSDKGCTDGADSMVFINAKPALTMLFNDACRLSPVNFTAAVSNGTPVTDYNWNFGDGSLGTGQTTSHIYTTNGNYPVTLYAISTGGCSSDTLSSPINIFSTSAFAGNDTIAAAGQPVQLNAGGGLSYEWISGTGLNNYFIANPVAITNQTTQYIVKAFTPQGCTSFDTVVIKIYKGPDIYLPTAFTPNNDGLNDILKGIPVGIKSFDYLIVYNRYGQKIFETTNYRTGWDGSFKGVIQSTGTYVVIVKGTDFSGKPIFKKQPVILIR